MITDSRCLSAQFDLRLKIGIENSCAFHFQKGLDFSKRYFKTNFTTPFNKTNILLRLPCVWKSNLKCICIVWTHCFFYYQTSLCCFVIDARELTKRNPSLSLVEESEINTHVLTALVCELGGCIMKVHSLKVWLFDKIRLLT